MSQFKIKVKLWAEVHIDAETKEEAEDKVWDEVEKGAFVDIGDLIIEYMQVTDVDVR